MSFETETKVRFGDVDAAGIVFYPRYFEMLNTAVEDWFDSMGFDFRSMHMLHRIGIPTVRLECDFVAPSSYGDELTIRISVVRVGRSSCTVDYVVAGRGQVRLNARGVLVCMNLETRRSIEWPDAIGLKLRAQA